MIRFLARGVAVAATVLVLGACERQSEQAGIAPAAQVADVVFTNGHIYTLDPLQPWARAVAVLDGRFAYVGDEAGAAAWVGEGTRREDMGGAMLLPGINDAHSHPWQGGVKQLFSCNFPFTAGPEEIATALRGCIERNPGNEWIVGGQWTSDFFRNHDIPSPRAFLDAVSTEHVIYLNDDAGHNAWVNSRALELAGINRDTPDPQGGAIVRDADGQANGLLFEEGRTPVWQHKPELSVKQYRAAIAEAVRQGSSFGLTGVNEARATEPVYQAYQRLDEAGELNLRVVANQQTPREYRDYPLDVDSHVAVRERYDRGRVQAGFIKIFLDGVPTASRTALMLADYTTDTDHPQPTRGMLMVDAEVLARDLVALDAAGFTVKIHTAGDGAVRVALDAVQAAREANGDSGLRHELAHAGYIDPSDLPRLAALDVTADLSPYIWYPSPIIDSVVAAVGERGERYFPVRDLLDTGAHVLMGSDWPSAAANLSPWHAIEALVTRRDPFGNGNEALWPEQAISLEEALQIATLGGARAMRLETLTGSIEVGKSADFIVLDRNLFEIPVEQVSDIRVQQTWFEGRRVYQRNERR